MKGLYNLGNTCYLNSILQILINTPKFPQVFHIYSNNLDLDNPSVDVAVSFTRLLNDYLNNDAAINESLVQFIKAFRKNHSNFGFGQNDQHEYLMFLLRVVHDNMHKDSVFSIHGASDTPQDRLERQSLIKHRIDGSSTTHKMLTEENSICYDSAIFRMFTGQYRFQTECQNPQCQYISNRFEAFRSWELPIGNPEKTHVNLQDSMNEFIGISQLDESDSYECDKCKERTRSLRKCTIWRLPDVLIINLKRNIYHNVKGQHMSFKDPRIVLVPKILDVSPYMTAQRNNSKYKLYATANHLGTPQGGHCYAQIEKDDKWYTIDDNAIHEGLADPSHIYLLFYQQCPE